MSKTDAIHPRSVVRMWSEDQAKRRHRARKGEFAEARSHAASPELFAADAGRSIMSASVTWLILAAIVAVTTTQSGYLRGFEGTFLGGQYLHRNLICLQLTFFALILPLFLLSAKSRFEAGCLSGRGKDISPARVSSPSWNDMTITGVLIVVLSIPLFMVAMKISDVSWLQVALAQGYVIAVGACVITACHVVNSVRRASTGWFWLGAFSLVFAPMLYDYFCREAFNYTSLWVTVASPLWVGMRASESTGLDALRLWLVSSGIYVLLAGAFGLISCTLQRKEEKNG